jgi:four helix bundle protein
MSMTFEDLVAWRKAREMVNAIYQATRQGPLVKDLALCGQIRRAAISVMSNIAEGFERTHTAEKLQSYNIARASCGEVRSLLYVIEDNYPPASATCCNIRPLAGDTGALVTGLITSTRKRLIAKTTAAAALLAGFLWTALNLA